jgi:hypothetical protein
MHNYPTITGHKFGIDDVIDYNDWKGLNLDEFLPGATAAAQRNTQKIMSLQKWRIIMCLLLIATYFGLGLLNAIVTPLSEVDALGIVFGVLKLIVAIVFVVYLILSVARVREAFRNLKKDISTWLMNNTPEGFEAQTTGFYIIIRKRI